MSEAMLSIFGDIEGVVAELYDYRYPITVVMVLGALGAAYLAFRAGLHVLLWRHRLATALIGAPLLVLSAVAGDYLLSPLWERSTLNEATPLQVTAAGMADSSVGADVPAGSRASFVPMAALKGMFVGADSFHFGRGDALIIETAPGRYVLRFENFSVRNGPDLFVYVSPDPSGYSEKAVNLGKLKATDGAFNYEIPAGTDVSQIKSAIVWCKQFAVLFAVATLGKA